MGILKFLFSIYLDKLKTHNTLLITKVNVFKYTTFYFDEIYDKLYEIDESL